MRAVCGCRGRTGSRSMRPAGAGRPQKSCRAVATRETVSSKGPVSNVSASSHSSRAAGRDSPNRALTIAEI